MSSRTLPLTILLTVLLLPLSESGAAWADELVFEEAFDSQDLGAGWSWLREDSSGWRLEKGRLRIRTNGQLWEGPNDQKNVLLRDPIGERASGVAAEVTVDGHLELDKAYEHGGLIWYLDDDNWVTLTLLNHVAHKTQKLMLVSEVDGHGLANTSIAIPFLDRSVTLRLVVEGQRFTGRFRRQGSSEWEKLGTITFSVKGERPRFGLVAGQGLASDEHWVAFDDFRLEALGE